MSLFGINLSNFLSVKATIITYVVVLLQFKLTDVQNSNKTNETSNNSIDATIAPTTTVTANISTV